MLPRSGSRSKSFWPIGIELLLKYLQYGAFGPHLTRLTEAIKITYRLKLDEIIYL